MEQKQYSLSAWPMIIVLSILVLLAVASEAVASALGMSGGIL